MLFLDGGKRRLHLQPCCISLGLRFIVHCVGFISVYCITSFYEFADVAGYRAIDSGMMEEVEVEVEVEVILSFYPTFRQGASCLHHHGSLHFHSYLDDISSFFFFFFFFFPKLLLLLPWAIGRDHVFQIHTSA